MMNSSPSRSPPSKVTDEGKMNMTTEGPPPFTEVSLMSSLWEAICYYPFNVDYLLKSAGLSVLSHSPTRPQYGPGLWPPLGLRDYAPGVPPGKRDVPFNP